LDKIVGTTGTTIVHSDATSVNPSADSLFTNPATGVEYNKKEIYALAGGNDLQRGLFRLMIKTDLARTNRILGAQ